MLTQSKGRQQFVIVPVSCGMTARSRAFEGALDQSSRSSLGLTGDANAAPSKALALTRQDDLAQPSGCPKLHYRLPQIVGALNGCMCLLKSIGTND